MASYRTRGSCSREIIFTVENDRIKNVKFFGGCSGNLQAMSKLVENMNIDKAIEMLRGIQCKNGTSCPDQLALALIDHKAKAAQAAEQAKLKS